MRLRYKKTKTETFGYRFNILALCEILTGDDSALCSELDVWVNGEWKDLHQAFKDKDIITDNYNTMIMYPPTEEDRERGFTL